MKTLILGSIALVGLLLVGLQHQQLGQLRAENVTLEQSSAEADRLKADLANSTGNEAQDAAEIERLREQNRDLLKLRNEVNQLRDARLQFEKVSAENQRLQLLSKNAVGTEAKSSTQPVVIRMDNLSNRGLGTPEDALQTFYWAQRERNSEALSRSMTQDSWFHFGNALAAGRGQDLGNIASIEIVARREVDATTVQLGVQLHETNNPQGGRKIIVTLALQSGNWRVQSTTYTY
jgi:hypothetical protein